MKTYDIQLKVDFVDPSKHDILLQAVREKAAEIYSLALLLKDKRDPQIAMQTGDLFEGTKEIAILAEDQARQDAIEAGE